MTPPTRSSDQDGKAGDPTAGDQRPRLKPAFQALFLIIALDLLAGLWLGIHRERAVEFFLSQVPLIGAAAVLWSFFPKDSQQEFAAWLEWLLGKKLVRRGLGVGLVLLAGITLFRVSATVDALDGAVATWVYVAPDRAGAPPTRAVLDSAKLNRLTSPVSFARWQHPAGLTAWLYSPTMISKSALRLRFWRSVSLAYPQDFDSLAAVALLPGVWLFNRLPRDTARVFIYGRGDPGDTVAVVAVDAGGSYAVSFLEPEPPSPQDAARWVDVLAGTPDSLGTSFMVSRWTRASWIAARRPIRQGERLEWTLTIGADPPRRDELVVRHAKSDLYLAN